MELFRRHTDDEDLESVEQPQVDVVQTETAEVPQPETDQEVEEDESDNTPRDWQMIGLQALAALIILLILIFGGRWLHHELSNNNGVKPAPANTKQLPAVPNGTTNSKAKPSSNSSPVSSSTPTPTTSSNSNLPNTGPGNDLALFLSVALAAASLHYLKTSKS